MKDDTVISTYTREQAVEDGVLCRVPSVIRTAHGITDDTCLSAGLWLLIQSDDPEIVRIRLNALLIAFRVACLGVNDTFLEFSTTIHLETVKVWAVLDGDGLTLMLPEDY